MEITVGKKIYNLEFTYNSMKYLSDFDITELSGLDRKPFKMITIAEQLLYASLNHDAKKPVSFKVASDYVEKQIDSEDGNLVELIEELTTLLTDSNFFKKLQAN